jgi:hypothetical protein
MQKPSWCLVEVLEPVEAVFEPRLRIGWERWLGGPACRMREAKEQKEEQGETGFHIGPHPQNFIANFIGALCPKTLS